MPTSFAKRRRGGVILKLDPQEQPLLRQLVGELLVLVEPAPAADADPLSAMVGIGTATETPDDPVLARLFPDAYPDDSAAAGEFRRYTEQGLREKKRSNAATALATLERGKDVELSDDEARAWLGVLNDLRLALGTRLDVDEDWDDQMASLGEDDPLLGLFVVYDWLSYLQETLVRSVS
jgi:hypothetical protein